MSSSTTNIASPRSDNYSTNNHNNNTPREVYDQKGDLRKRALRKVHVADAPSPMEIKNFNKSIRHLEDYKPFKIDEGNNYLSSIYWFDLIREYTLDMEIFQTILALSSAIFFIISTYIQLEIDGRLTAILVVDLIFSLFFIFFFLVNFFLAKDKKWYFVHPLSILDYITVVPSLTINTLSIIGGWSGLEDIYSFVGLLRVFRLLRLIPLIKKISSKGDINSIYAKVAELGLTIACLLMIFTGVFQWLENNFGQNVNIYYHDALYFIGITLVTIGYGDITPTHWTSKFAVLSFFIIGVTIIPIQLSGIYAIVTAEKTIFKVKNPVLKKHAIITGNCRIDEVIDFIKECFQYKSNEVEKIILLFNDRSFCQSLTEGLRKFDFNSKIQVLFGEIMDFEIMSLLKISEAHSVFLLNSPKIGNPKQQDTNIIMTTIALRNFNPKLHVYAQINLIESKSLIQKAGAKVIVCYESICSKVMSACSTSPVFSSFLYNLLSGADVDIDHEKLGDYVFSNNFISEQENDINWIIEYSDGMNNELYRANFSPVFYGSLFIDIAELLRRSDITIFALESNGTIYINPSKYRIKEGDKCYCIAPSIEYAELVENFKISAAELSQFRSNKEAVDVIEYELPTEDIEEGNEIFEQDFTEYVKSMDNASTSSRSSSSIQQHQQKHQQQQQKKLENEKKMVKTPRLLSPRLLTPRLRINQLLRMRTEANVDISLLRDADDDDHHNVHLEILLKLVSPELYFQDKRKYLKSIRTNFSGSDLDSKEKEFYQKITKTYYMEDRPIPKDDFFIKHHKDKSIKDHLILLGDFSQPAIVCALSRSLQRHSRDVPIVLMTDKANGFVVDVIYQRLRFFSQVFIINGSYLKTTDLRKAGFSVCKKILYFATEDKSNEIVNEYTVDSEAIKLSLGMSVMDKNKGYVLELVNRANMKFFQHQGIPTHLKVKKMREDGLLDYDIDEFDQFCLFSDYYISGRVFPSSSFLSKLLSQSFHNRKIVDLIEQLCADEFTAGEHQSVVIEIPLPSAFIGRSVLHLVTSCYEHNLILMALSRVKTNKPSDRYIYTNPSLSKTLAESDLVFVCGHRKDIKELLTTRGTIDRFFVRSWTKSDLLIPTTHNDGVSNNITSNVPKGVGSDSGSDSGGDNDVPIIRRRPADQMVVGEELLIIQQQEEV